MNERIRISGRRRATPHRIVSFGREGAWHTGGADRFGIEQREDDVRRLTRDGMSAPDIALQLKVSDRSVSRIRARLRARGEL